jgi:hypothetical protein
MAMAISMAMSDFGRLARKRVIESAPAETAEQAEKRVQDQLQAKRQRAIKMLGARWCMHPNYRLEANPHHARSVKTSAILSAWMRGQFRHV